MAAGVKGQVCREKGRGSLLGGCRGGGRAAYWAAAGIEGQRRREGERGRMEEQLTGWPQGGEWAAHWVAAGIEGQMCRDDFDADL